MVRALPGGPLSDLVTGLGRAGCAAVTEFAAAPRARDIADIPHRYLGKER